jgi:hypothetical protein
MTEMTSFKPSSRTKPLYYFRGATMPTSTTTPALPIPMVIRRSRLYQAGGFVFIDDLLDKTSLAQLQREALQIAPQAHENLVAESDHVEGRGGSPARKFLSSSGGTIQDSLYQSKVLKQLLEAQIQAPIKSTGTRGTFTFYTRVGDHLALHRDVITCDLTLITCLFNHSKNPSETPSGSLRVYPQYNLEPLQKVQKTHGINLDLQMGQSLALLGGIVPHEVLPTSATQMRVVSVLCFEVLIGT